MRTSRVLMCSALVAGVCGSTHANCPVPPAISAVVKVESCVGVTFEASESRWGFGADPQPLYQKGARFAGTLISAIVQTSHIDSQHRHLGSYLKLHVASWAPGSIKSLFVRVPASEACPKNLPSTITVTAVNIGGCCDVLPGADVCLIPTSVEWVELGKWPK